MTIHRGSFGFTFTPPVTPTNLHGFPLLADVKMHFDEGILAGLQLSDLRLVLVGSEVAIVSNTLTAIAGLPDAAESLCNEIHSAYDEYRSLSAADPSAEGFPLSAYAGRELPRL